MKGMSEEKKKCKCWDRGPGESIEITIYGNCIHCGRIVWTPHGFNLYETREKQDHQLLNGLTVCFLLAIALWASVEIVKFFS